MRITRVTMEKIDSIDRGKIKAIASILIDDEFVVNDIKVIEGKKELFIAMPSKRTADGEFKDIAHPINAEIREKIQTAVFAKYYENE